MAVPDMLALMEAQEKEHEAWRVAMDEWRAAFPDADPNDKQYDPLIKAIELWGERLVALRITDPDTITRALDSKRRLWARADVERRDAAKGV